MSYCDFFLSLTDEEKTQIAAVLQRDVEEQNRQKKKVGLVKLKIDLLTEKRQNLSTSAESKKGFKNGSICSLCGFIFPSQRKNVDSEVTKPAREIFSNNTICSYCKLKICQGCCNKTSTAKTCCRLCFLKREYSAVTGMWCKKPINEERQRSELGVNADVDQVLSISNSLLSQIKKSDRRSSVVGGIKAEKEMRFIGKYRMMSEKLETEPENARMTNNFKNPFDEVSFEDANTTMSAASSAERLRSTHNLSLPSPSDTPYSRPQIYAPKKHLDSIGKRANSCNRISVLQNVDILDRKIGSDSFDYSYLYRTAKDDAINPSCSKSSDDNRLSRNSRNSSGERSYLGSNDNVSLRLASTLSLNSTNSEFAVEDKSEINYCMDATAGHILLSIEYDYSSAILNVIVFRCKDLVMSSERKRQLNPYVKVYLLPDKSDSGKKKTKCKRATDNPAFNETLRFHGLTKAEVEKRVLLVSVWHSDLLGKNQCLGDVHINLSDYRWNSNDGGQWFALEIPRKALTKTSKVSLV